MEQTGERNNSQTGKTLNKYCLVQYKSKENGILAPWMAQGLHWGRGGFGSSFLGICVYKTVQVHL